VPQKAPHDGTDKLTLSPQKTSPKSTTQNKPNPTSRSHTSNIINNPSLMTSKSHSHSNSKMSQRSIHNIHNVNNVAITANMPQLHAATLSSQTGS